MKKTLKPSMLPALAASAVCGAALYALKVTLSYLFRARLPPRQKDATTAKIKAVARTMWW